MVPQKLSKNKEDWYILLILIFEYISVILLLFLSYYIAEILIYRDSFYLEILDKEIFYMTNVASALILLVVNKYFAFWDKLFSETIVKITEIIILQNVIYIAILYFSGYLKLSLTYFVLLDTIQVASLIATKNITQLFKFVILKNRKTLVIGSDARKNELFQTISKKCVGQLTFVSIDENNLRNYIDEANNIYISGSVREKLKDRVISYCVLKEKRVFIVPETYEIAVRNSVLTQVGDIPVFAVESFRLPENKLFFKRLMDLILSIVGILVSTPLMMLAVIGIKLEDGGPIFYTQERSGLNGKIFRVIKFRSMVVDAEKFTGAVFASNNDLRITKMGKLMRATRVDEIPQFFNVLIGNMSMIGPRPERPVFVKEFCKELPEYINRLSVKPGITGLAQVMGNYTTTPANKVKYDLVYIRNYSILLDFKIVIKTILVIFSKIQSKGFEEKDNQKIVPVSKKQQDGNDIKESIIASSDTFTA